MSGKSKTIGDFTVSRPSQTFPTGNRRHPRSSGMVADKSGKSGVLKNITKLRIHTITIHCSAVPDPASSTSAEGKKETF